MKVLLGRNEVDHNKPSKYGRTPLSRAASGGHAGAAKILLERDYVNPDQPDKDDQNRYGMLRRTGTRKWWKCYSGEATSTPTNQISTAKYRSSVLLRTGTRK